MVQQTMAFTLDPTWSGSESLSLELHVTRSAGLLFISNSLNSAVWRFVQCFFLTSSYKHCLFDEVAKSVKPRSIPCFPG